MARRRPQYVRVKRCQRVHGASYRSTMTGRSLAASLNAMGVSSIGRRRAEARHLRVCASRSRRGRCIARGRAMSALTLSAGAALVYDNINAAGSPDILDNIARAIWHDWGKGAFTDDEASFLTAAVDRRRPVTFHRPSRNGAGPARTVGSLLGRIGSRYTPRPARRRLTDEERTKRRHRKRMLGGSSALPDTLRPSLHRGRARGAVRRGRRGEAPRHLRPVHRRDHRPRRCG
jgi:hypothetical protein